MLLKKYVQKPNNIMKYLRSLIAIVLILSLYNCSTMSVNKQVTSLSAITANKTYQLRVRSGNIYLDKIIHEYASTGFGPYLQMSSKKIPNSLIEIVFTGTSKHGDAGYTTNVLYGDTWYTADDNSGIKSYNPMAETEISPGRILSSQQSTMIVTLKDLEGKILWGAHYNYKGAYEVSGLYTKTADEAVRLSLDRILQQFEKDFIIIPEPGNKTQNKKPTIALIVEKQKSPAPQTSLPHD